MTLPRDFNPRSSTAVLLIVPFAVKNTSQFDSKPKGEHLLSPNITFILLYDCPRDFNPGNMVAWAIE